MTGKERHSGKGRHRGGQKVVRVKGNLEGVQCSGVSKRFVGKSGRGFKERGSDERSLKE